MDLQVSGQHLIAEKVRGTISGDAEPFVYSDLIRAGGEVIEGSNG